MPTPSFKIEHRSDRPARPRSSIESPPHVPRLVLDKEATIRELNGAARAILEYPPDVFIEPYFFSHVHRRNMRRVMQDLAQMIRHGKTHVRWLLRLQTGTERWRWYRAEVENRLHRPDGGIQVQLHPL